MSLRALMFSASPALLALGALCFLPGCSRLEDKRPDDGPVVGGVSGSLAEFAGGGLEKDKTVAAMLGLDVGAGGGFLIGARPEKIEQKNKDDAAAAEKKAELKPATVADAESARTADLNEDGFVTLDEVVAIKRANVSDHETVQRIERTGQVFTLSEEQAKYLQDRGVSASAIATMRQMGPPGQDAQTASERQTHAPQQPRRDLTQSGMDPSGRRVPRDQQPRDFERFRQGDAEGASSRRF